MTRLVCILASDIGWLEMAEGLNGQAEKKNPGANPPARGVTRGHGEGERG